MPEFDLRGLFVANKSSQCWGTYRMDRSTGSMERVHSRNRLPDRATREEAEADLRAYLVEMATRGRSPLLRKAACVVLKEHGWLEGEG